MALGMKLYSLRSMKMSNSHACFALFIAFDSRVNKVSLYSSLETSLLFKVLRPSGPNY